jgi:hypothetical protein
MDAVDTSTLEKTIGNLERALTMLSEAHDPSQAWLARSAVVTEYTLCWGRVRPLLERALTHLDDLAPSAVSVMSLSELIRTANELGYTGVDWEDWKKFRDVRNKAAHAYREEVADAIVSQARRLLDAASEVSANVKRKEE